VSTQEFVKDLSHWVVTQKLLNTIWVAVLRLYGPACRQTTPLLPEDAWWELKLDMLWLE